MKLAAFGCAVGLALAAASPARAQGAPEPAKPAPGPEGPTEGVAAPVPPAVPTPPTSASPPPPPPLGAESASSAPAVAAPAPVSEVPKGAEVAYVTPDSPAATLLDLSNAKVDRPASAPKLGLALVNLVTAQGTLRSGVVIEVSPRLLGVANRWSNAEYRRDFWKRFVARSGLSVATASDAASATQPSIGRAAVGARFVFIDDSDPLLDTRYVSAVEYAKQACRDKHGEEEQDCLVSAYKSFHWPDAKWNYGGLALAVAESFQFTEAKVANVDTDTLGVWLSVAAPIGEIAQIAPGIYYQRAWRAQTDTVVPAVRLRVGGQTVRWTADGSAFFHQPDDHTLPRGRVATGLEAKVSSSLWLSASFGTDLGVSEALTKVFVLSNLKWNVAETAPW